MRTNAFTLALVLFVSTALTQAQFKTERSFTLSSGRLGVDFLAKGDFNHDGKLDVLLPATSATGTPELAVFPGNGMGGFGAAIITPVSGANNITFSAAGDLNGDGIPDVVIQGTDPITAVTEMGVMLADGAGKFNAPVFTKVPIFIQVVLGDFNGDKKLDLVGLTSSSEIFFPGKSDGTFGASVTTSSVLAGGGCSAVADFNKDGKLDITTGTQVLLGNGNGTFQAPRTVVNGGCDVAVGDFNNDGFPDLVTATSVKRGTAGARVFLGDGSGNFTTSTVYNTGASVGTQGPAFAIDNFNGDANQDIAVLNLGNNDVTILIGKANGTFTIGKTFAAATGGILSGDFNGDHKTDLAVRTNQGLAFSVILGNGNGTLNAATAQNGQLGGTIHLADINGDGKIDALEFATNGNPSAVLLGNGTGTFGARVPLPSSCQADDGVIVDLNKDKKPDLAFAAGSGGGVAICLGNGDGTFKPAVIVDSGVQHGLVFFGDFNHDGKMDLAATDVGGISILPGNGDGTFKTAIPTALTNFQNPVAGDFNHDGKLDILAITGGNGAEFVVLLGKGDGTFEAPVTTSAANTNGPLAVGDVDGDGFPDVVTTKLGGPNGVDVFLGNGDGTFKAPIFHALFGVESMQLRDLNGDGKLDLVAASFGFLDVLLGNGNGTFQTAKNYPAPIGRVSFGVADINGDGRLDVAYLSQTGSGAGAAGTLTLYLNQGP
ncbi:MAG TPA: VCBS repeat-containing protein [Candidatus Sulfotelmatobacter sp.]|nr:VCBS repeat-containing protein [Candidatus Sulfotelmatobacter sp.]